MHVHVINSAPRLGDFEERHRAFAALLHQLGPNLNRARESACEKEIEESDERKVLAHTMR